MAMERLTGRACLTPEIAADPAAEDYPVVIPVLLDDGPDRDGRIVHARVDVDYLERLMESLRLAQRTAATERAHQRGMQEAREEFARRHPDRVARPVLAGMIIHSEQMTTVPGPSELDRAIERGLQAAARARRADARWPA